MEMTDTQFSRDFFIYYIRILVWQPRSI